MTSDREKRSKLTEVLLLGTPSAAAFCAGMFLGCGLPDWVLKHAPTATVPFARYALQAAPVGWCVLALGCALGTCLPYEKRGGGVISFCVTLAILTFILFAAHVLIGAGMAIAGCACVGGQFDVLP